MFTYMVGELSHFEIFKVHTLSSLINKSAQTGGSIQRPFVLWASTLSTELSGVVESYNFDLNHNDEELLLG